MACGNCGGQRTGYRTVWEHRLVGKEPVPFATQAEAEAARAAADGKGMIVKASRKIA